MSVQVIRRGILRPRQAVQRVTANAGNRAFVAGGAGKNRQRAPHYTGPAIPPQSWAVGVAIVPIALRDSFTGVGHFVVTDLPAGVTVDRVTGIIAGTPTAAGSGPSQARLEAVQDGVPAAVAPTFLWTVT
jgi:hypothetical protein